MIPFLLLALAGTLPTTVSGNFSQDLYGPVDGRMANVSCNAGPCIWGHADSSTLPIRFFPPAGYRVRILAIDGDLMAFVKSLPGDPATPDESQAGILGGFQTSSSGPTPDCTYCTSGCSVYVQDAVGASQPKTRAAFERPGLLLDADNLLIAKVAEYLNTTGKPIHLELTYTIQYRFEKTP